MNNILRTIKKICVIALLAIITGAAIMNAGCNKKFDAPPLESTDTPAVTMTIKDLKTMHIRGKYETITTDGVISGIVTANDSTGNFYQEIVIQDNTGGLAVMLNVTSGLYTTYPVGRKIFISIKGLILGDYGGSIQLGGGIAATSSGGQKVDGIASTLIDNYITRGTFHNVVEPLHISDLSQIDTSMQSPQSNILVTLDSFEFPAVMLDSTYADTTAAKKSRGFNLENCSGQVIELYNSGYANFASFKVPQGRGVITGIYTKFNTTKELLIRDTSDIKFYGARCSGGTTPAGGDTISISDVRKIGNGTIPANSIIKGIVVSNAANEAAGNYRLEAEDGSAGIILYFSTTPATAWTVGQEISVNVGGLTVAPYKGDLEISKVPAATLLGTGTITPKVATIAEIQNSLNDWASTLVTIKNVTIKQQAGTGNLTDTISDGTGTILTYIRSTANITPPAQASSITGYVSVFQATDGSTVAQLGLRDQDDIVSGSTTPPDDGSGSGSSVLSEDFASATDGGNTASTGDGSPSGAVWAGDDNFPTVSKAYSAGGMIKLGTSSAVGYITSKTLDLTGNSGNYTVKLDVKGWISGSGTKSGNIVVTSSENSTGVTQSYTATSDGSMQTLTFSLSGGTASTTITISSTSDSYRAFIDNISIQQ